MRGTNKLTGKMELVLLRYEWISLFGHGTFQRYVSFFLLDSFELQGVVCLTKHGAISPSLNISRRTYCTGYDEHACDTIIFPNARNWWISLWNW